MLKKQLIENLIPVILICIIGFLSLYQFQKSEVIEIPLPEKNISYDQSVENFKEIKKVFLKSNMEEIELNNDLNCLTANIFFESGNQSDLGKTAVAHVTLKRKKLFKSNNICEAVTKSSYDSFGFIKVNMCHFSWYCDNDLFKEIPDDVKSFKSFNKSKFIAEKALSGNSKDPTNGADHYCTLDVEKKWLTERKGGAWWIDYMIPSSRVVIGKHVFYKHDPKRFFNKKRMV
jgi:spore germination cell wall hydrolase CwlJ-like protein